MRSLMEIMPVQSFRHEFARHARWHREEDRHVLNRNNESEEKEKARERDLIEDRYAFMDFAFSLPSPPTNRLRNWRKSLPAMRRKPSSAASVTRSQFRLTIPTRINSPQSRASPRNSTCRASR